MIKNVLLKQRCKLLAKKKRKEHLSYENASTIGILYNASEYKRELIEELAESFKQDGKSLAMMAFTEKESEEPLTFTRKDISVSGSLTKEPVHLFIKQAFDFLIALDDSGDINFKYILALSKATCKVGMNSEAYGDHLVMSIKPSTGHSNGLEDIKKYLKMI